MSDAPKLSEGARDLLRRLLTDKGAVEVSTLDATIVAELDEAGLVALSRSHLRTRSQADMIADKPIGQLTSRDLIAAVNALFDPLNGWVLSDEWRCIHIDYEHPHVFRMWRQVGDKRLLLHRLEPVPPEASALWHPHPWPSANFIIRGAYEMDVTDSTRFALSPDRRSLQPVHGLPVLSHDEPASLARRASARADAVDHGRRSTLPRACTF
jgi:hypothetical protein